MVLLEKQFHVKIIQSAKNNYQEDYEEWEIKANKINQILKTLEHDENV